MAKRFTDTEIWKKKWFRALSPKMKCAWHFLTTQCDSAGVWEIDTDLMSIFIGEEIDLDELLNVFGERLLLFKESKLWIVDFCAYQYGNLKENYNPHKAALISLKKYDLISKLNSSLNGACDKLLDKDQYQDKDKDKDQDKDQDKESEKAFFEKAKSAWKEATGTGTMGSAEKKIKNLINTDEKKNELLLAIENYGRVLAIETDRPMKTSLDTFIGSLERKLYYRDYIDQACIKDAMKRASRKNSIASKEQAKEDFMLEMLRKSEAGLL